MVRKIKSFSIKLVIQKPLTSQIHLQHLKSPSKTIIFKQFLLIGILSNTLSAFQNQMILLVFFFFSCNPLANIPKFQFTFITYSIHYKIEEQYRIQNTHSYALLPYKSNMHPRTFTSFFLHVQTNIQNMTLSSFTY